MKILITGVTGTLGRAVTDLLLANHPEVDIWGIARDEQKMRTMPRHDRLHLRLCDIKDKEALEDVFHAADGFYKVLHFAALKCVDTLEDFPVEAVKTNVLGTHNIVTLARQTMCNRMLLASTDKAVYPINAYGHTKALAEKLVLEGGENNVVCRYGNILGSRGSFLLSLVESLKNKKKAYFTCHDMTRFWTTIDTIAAFVLESAFASPAGLRIPTPMKSSSVLDLIETTADLLGVKAYELVPIGIRRGEKIHEYLQTAEESETGVPLISCSARMDREELGELLMEALA
jgi:UDP-N-acetylglucosamine 4,6-dehydratase